MLTCALFALVGCEPRGERDAAPATWVYPPPPVAWPIGPVRGTIGRSQPPQLTQQLGIRGSQVAPLRMPTPWAVPGPGPARAVVYGTVDGASAVELIDIDDGVVRWRDTSACGGPIVGVTEQAIVCADARGTRALDLDGKLRWNVDAAFVALTADRVVTAGAGEAVILDAEDGGELARVKLPASIVPRGKPAAAPVAVESIVASCGDAGRELFAYGQSGELVRVAEAAGGSKLSWATPLPTVVAIDACDGATILVTVAGPAGTALVALARDTGALTGTVEGVRGFWPARDGSERLEISTSSGVRIYPRDLTGVGEPTVLPVFAELLAKRGELRLVRATKLTAALLDAHGVRAYLPLAGRGAVLGEHTLIAGSWLGSPGETSHRFALPERYRRQLRVPPDKPALAVPAELRDLPARVELDLASAIGKPDAAAHELGAIALDPVEPAVLAATVERGPDDTATAGVARFDLAARAWSWYAQSGCGVGTPVALAVSRELIACAARTGKGATVQALGRDGSARWQWQGTNIDAVQAAADIVLVHDADRVHVIDGRDGRELATYASDDGGPARAAALDVDGMAMVVVYQRGLVLARLPHVDMVPAWTLAVAGVASTLEPAGDGVLVGLEDGDAYRIDARTGASVALPGLGLVWHGSGDVVTGQAPGGPIPPEVTPAPATPVNLTKRPVRRRASRPPPPRDRSVDPPRLPTPWPAPPPLAASWQLTLYELSGAVRIRNDYAVAAVAPEPAPRGPGDSPIVVQFGLGSRELLVIEPRRGDPVRRVHVPDDVAPGTAFGTLVDGKPVVGVLLESPLRAVLF